MIGAGPRRLPVLILLPVALMALGLLVETRGLFPQLRFGISRAAADAPSTLAVPPGELARGVSTVSLYLRPEDLHDPATGILANARKHGNEWERPGWVSFFENGRLVYSTGAGVRIHGGSSRETTSRPQGFRLYFRRKYSANPLPGEVAFGPSHGHPLRRLILHNDMRIGRDRVRWHLVNPLAYDIATAVGAIASPTRPVRFLLNGVFQDVFVLSEHFHPRDYFVAHRGYPVSLNYDEFNQMWRQVRAMRPIRMAAIGHLVDLDNLTRWFIATVFCATHDAYQGPGQFRDPMRESSQWFWVNWDMDGSFRLPEQDTFWYLLSRTGQPRGRRPNEPRPRILVTLLDDDPEYRAYFQRVWTDVMNHVLTPAFLDERFEHYRAEADRLDLRRTARTRRRSRSSSSVVRRWSGRSPRTGCGPAPPSPAAFSAHTARSSSTAGVSHQAGRGRTSPGCACTLSVPPELTPRSRTGSSTAPRCRAPSSRSTRPRRSTSSPSG